MIKFFSSESPEGVEITPAEMARRFHVALSTRGPEEDPSQPVKAFLFFNALPIIDYLAAQ